MTHRKQSSLHVTVCLAGWAMPMLMFFVALSWHSSLSPTPSYKLLLRHRVQSIKPEAHI